VRILCSTETNSLSRIHTWYMYDWRRRLRRRQNHFASLYSTESTVRSASVVTCFSECGRIVMIAFVVAPRIDLTQYSGTRLPVCRARDECIHSCQIAPLTNVLRRLMAVVLELLWAVKVGFKSQWRRSCVLPILSRSLIFLSLSPPCPSLFWPPFPTLALFAFPFRHSRKSTAPLSSCQIKSTQIY